MDHEPTDLRNWLTRTETSEEKLADDVEKRGGRASSKYLEHIANGNYEPGWQLCEVLEKITGIDARKIKTYAYRRSTKKHAA
jgi:hypothetical protein